MESLLDIVCTEAIESGGMNEMERKREATAFVEQDNCKTTNLPFVNYCLELIQEKDGSFNWYE